MAQEPAVRTVAIDDRAARMTDLGWPETAPGGDSALGWPRRQSVPAAGAPEPDGEAIAPPTAAPPPPPVPAPAPTPPPVVSRETEALGPTSWMLGPLVTQQQPPAGDVSRETTADAVAETDETAPLADLEGSEGDGTTATELGSDDLDAELLAATRPAPPEAWPRPAARRLITVANQKGGVGKTTSTVNLAASLAEHGARVLVIDLDPQGNASTAFGVEHREGTPSVYDVLVQGRSIAEVVVAVEAIPNLDCVPATIDLAGAEIELVSMVARESRLHKALAAIEVDYDYVLVDCPPSLGLLTVNALVAAREVLIPIQCEFYALEGLSQLLRNIELVRAHLNPALGVSTILLTMYDGRTRLAEQVAAEVRDHFGPLVLSATIPRSVRISEAPGFGQSVITYDPTSRGALAYAEAAHEIATRSADQAEGTPS